MKTKSQENGQALIELIVFLPLMFTVYAIISGFANAINGSINQQKITRGYFYYRIQNNSMIPKPDEGKSYQQYSQFGMYFVGWKESLINDEPAAPCYKISLPLKAGPGDNCIDTYQKESTLFMRVGTVYGVCGATYAYRGPENIISVPDSPNAGFTAIVAPSGCLIAR